MQKEPTKILQCSGKLKRETPWGAEAPVRVEYSSKVASESRKMSRIPTTEHPFFTRAKTTEQRLA